MNKKILAKTLLPIAIVAILGGGIASSLILTNCSGSSSFKQLNFFNKQQAVSYVNKNSLYSNHNFSAPETLDDYYSINVLPVEGALLQCINIEDTDINSETNDWNFTLQSPSLTSEDLIITFDSDGWKLTHNSTVKYLYLKDQNAWSGNAGDKLWSFCKVSVGGKNSHYLSFSKSYTVTSCSGASSKFGFSFDGWDDVECYNETDSKFFFDKMRDIQFWLNMIIHESYIGGYAGELSIGIFTTKQKTTIYASTNIEESILTLTSDGYVKHFRFSDGGSGSIASFQVHIPDEFIPPTHEIAEFTIGGSGNIYLLSNEGIFVHDIISIDNPSYDNPIILFYINSYFAESNGEILSLPLYLV